MIIKLFVRGFLSVLVIFINQTLSRTIEISAYGSESNYSSPARWSDERQSVETGRAMSSAGYRNSFDDLFRKPITSYQDPQKTQKYIVYPSNSQSADYSGTSKTAVAMDRFAPGEAYGGTVYKIVKARENKIKYGYQDPKLNAAPLNDAKPQSTTSSLSLPPPPPTPAIPVSIPIPALPSPITPPPPVLSIIGPTPNPSTTTAAPPPPPVTIPVTSTTTTPSNQYNPPPDLYQFAPNIHSQYTPPANGDLRFNGVSSYLPPPAGTSDDAPSVDTGPQPVDSPDSLQPAPTPPAPQSPSDQYIPPDSLFQFPPNIHSHYHPPPPKDPSPNGISSYLPPPAGPNDSSNPPPASEVPSVGPAVSDDTVGTIPIGPNSPYPSYLPPQQAAPPSGAPVTMQQMPPQMMMMGMPPANNMMMMGMPPSGGPPMDLYFHGYYPHDHYPEYFFDHDHHHDHFHDEPPPVTTTPPPPPPPEPPKRLKNFSYYYVTRFFWYIPLYFSLYMLFYVLILILRFVARRKVNIPNQWTGRSLNSMQYLTNDQAVDKAELMANFVMKQIEEFKEKYL